MTLLIAFIFSITNDHAFAAAPFAAFEMMSIFLIECVSTEAMSFSRIMSPWAVAAEIVNSWGHSFKMFWVYARFIFAQMIDLKTLANRPFGELIRYSIGGFLTTSNFESPISGFVFGSNPDPAGLGLFNFGKKSVDHPHAGTLIYTWGQA